MLHFLPAENLSLCDPGSSLYTKFQSHVQGYQLWWTCCKNTTTTTITIKYIGFSWTRLLLSFGTGSFVFHLSVLYSISVSFVFYCSKKFCIVLLYQETAARQFLQQWLIICTTKLHVTYIWHTYMWIQLYGYKICIVWLISLKFLIWFGSLYVGQKGTFSYKMSFQ